jgi:hypothetical protein
VTGAYKGVCTVPSGAALLAQGASERAGGRTSRRRCAHWRGRSRAACECQRLGATPAAGARRRRRRRRPEGRRLSQRPRPSARAAPGAPARQRGGDEAGKAPARARPPAAAHAGFGLRPRRARARVHARPHWCRHWHGQRSAPPPSSRLAPARPGPGSLRFPSPVPQADLRLTATEATGPLEAGGIIQLAQSAKSQLEVGIVSCSITRARLSWPQTRISTRNPDLEDLTCQC